METGLALKTAENGEMGLIPMGDATINQLLEAAHGEQKTIDRATKGLDLVKAELARRSGESTDEKAKEDTKDNPPSQS